MNTQDVKKYCKELIATKLKVPVEDIADDATFLSLRINSVHVMQMVLELEDKFNIEVNPLMFWEHPTVGSFCDAISNRP